MGKNKTDLLPHVHSLGQGNRWALNTFYLEEGNWPNKDLLVLLKYLIAKFTCVFYEV